ncbi:carbonic anhydrase [Clostridium sp. BJN0001]|uniref:carbonic anhydrase n=1 Tax=Clostridium sp. BJN0001 TaxID=2930219 RepID=UPI001FD39A88|nr:carbonic anhydrase [Clostridium sp. BJN0001]
MIRNKKFATLLNCIDGRTQIPAINWIRNNFDIEYVDLITEPGIDKLISLQDKKFMKLLEEKILISLEKHESKMIFIAGHYDCAANDVSKDEHLKQIKASVQIIKKSNKNVRVIGLWINEHFEVEMCCGIGKLSW